MGVGREANNLTLLCEVVTSPSCYGTSTDASFKAEDTGGQGPIWAVAPLDGWMYIYYSIIILRLVSESRFYHQEGYYYKSLTT
jgi:hypothetical protein